MKTSCNALIAAAHIGDAQAGKLLKLRAEVTSTGLVETGPTNTYRVTLREGRAELDLLFLGRPLIRGFTPGRRCVVTGRVADRHGRLVLWNPRYELLPLTTNPPTSIIEMWHPRIGYQPEVEDTVPTKDVAAAGASNAEVGNTQRIGGVAGPGNTEAAVVEQAGRFRVYLGPAAGVGKTYAMLDEAHRRQERGCDVVVALVETHGRPATAAKLAGLEVIPPKIIHYRGGVFQEMDLEAVLARRPGVVLVDELAHSNLPGSGRNEKRWQDVRDLLAADISVISTLNVQHIESLAEVVERVTGVQSRERVPDELLRGADQIELVDSSPEQLRRRMLHGNIYPPERARQALSGFFRTDTLSALRELTLRFLADDIDDKLIDRLTVNSPSGLEVTERVMVGIAPTIGADVVLRRAARLAARLKADLFAVHVRTLDSGRPESTLVTELRALASGLGAQWHEVDGDPALALLDFATRHRITQVVLGRSSRSRWQRLTRGGSTVRRMTRRAMAADIDLHIVARDLPGPFPSIQGMDADLTAYN